MKRARRIHAQIPVFLSCVAAAGLASFAFDPATATRFSGYGGGLAPVTVLAICLPLGAAALWHLARTGFFVKRPGKRKLKRPMLLTLLFAAITIAVDLIHPFPADINARFPQSLLFYPTIAVLAETAFHLVPAALVFTLTKRTDLTIALVALSEPAFQLAAGWIGPPHWADLVTGLNIFCISVVQLILFRRHGFVAMLAFRLAYYLWWHVVWGEARLAFLF